MNKKLKFNFKIYILIALLTLTIPIAFAGWFDFLKGADVTGKAINTVNFNTSVVISQNAAPVITQVSVISSQTPTAASTTAVSFWFVANDTNGASDLTNSTSSAIFSSSGETSRTNTSCTGVNDPSSQSRNFSCVVLMYYYDAAATWVVNVSVNDSANAKAYNDTTSFTYNSDLNINLSATSLSWTGLGANSFNNSAASPINVTNIGNKIITNISVKAFDLLKDGTSSTYLIGAGNFSTTNGSSCALGYKNILVNNTEVNMTASNMTTYLYGKGKNVTSVYYCLDVPAALPTGTYNTTNQWITKACC